MIATPGQVFPDELILAVACFAVATYVQRRPPSASFSTDLRPVIALGGALIDLSINLIVGTLAFWFVQVDALHWIVAQLEQEFPAIP